MTPDSHLLWRGGRPPPYDGYTTDALIPCWQQLCLSAAVLDARGRPPRLHDLRHSMAAAALHRWYAAGRDPQAKLPHLATYLGHVSPVSTHHYIHLTADLRQAASRRFHQHIARLFKKGGGINMNASSTLARTLQTFFLDYLPAQRSLSPNTCQSYRDSLKLLLQFITAKSGEPSRLRLEELTVERVLGFLQHVETARRNCTSTRNVRLSAIHSFFRYVGAQHPEHLAQAQRVLSIPFKRTGQRQIHHLEFSEIQAVLDNIDRATVRGRRDFALLTVLFNTGARVSEIAGLQARDLYLAAPAHLLLRGKGRKERTCPLWAETARLLRELLAQHHIPPEDPRPVFLNRHGQPLTRFGIRRLLQKHIRVAAQQMPSLRQKRLHPHSVRHSTAIYLLRSGVDLSTIAHWLGHVSVNTTNKYLSLDLEAKREALAKAKPLLASKQKTGVWRRDTDLIAWLAAL